MYHYRLYHFLVTSDIALPCEPAAVDQSRQFSGSPDGQPFDDLPVHDLPVSLGAEAETPERLTIRWVELSNVPLGQRLAETPGGLIQAYTLPEGLLLHLGQSSESQKSGSLDIRIKIEPSGSDITIQAPPASADIAAYYTVALAVPICLLLRGYMPLHGACVEIDGQVAGVMGRSGAGKSTLTYNLFTRGCRVGGDDVLAVDVSYSEAGRAAGVKVIPARGLALKLRQRALHHYSVPPSQRLGMAAGDDSPARRQAWVKIPAASQLTAVSPLAALFVLRPRDAENEGAGSRIAQAGIVIRRLRGAEALALLLTNTQGMWAAFPYLAHQMLMQKYAAMVQALPLYEVTYEKRFEILPRLEERLAEAMRTSVL